MKAQAFYYNLKIPQHESKKFNIYCFALSLKYNFRSFALRTRLQRSIYVKTYLRQTYCLQFIF